MSWRFNLGQLQWIWRNLIQKHSPLISQHHQLIIKRYRTYFGKYSSCFYYDSLYFKVACCCQSSLKAGNQATNGTSDNWATNFIRDYYIQNWFLLPGSLCKYLQENHADLLNPVQTITIWIIYLSSIALKHKCCPFANCVDHPSIYSTFKAYQQKVRSPGAP